MTTWSAQVTAAGASSISNTRRTCSGTASGRRRLMMATSNPVSSGPIERASSPLPTISTRAPGAAAQQLARQRPVGMPADVLQEPRADGTRVGEQRIHQLTALALQPLRSGAQIFAPGSAQLPEDVGLTGNRAAQAGRDLEQGPISLDAAIRFAARIARRRLRRREVNLDIALTGAHAERGWRISPVPASCATRPAQAAWRGDIAAGVRDPLGLALIRGGNTR